MSSVFKSVVECAALGCFHVCLWWNAIAISVYSGLDWVVTLTAQLYLDSLYLDKHIS